MHVSCTQCHAAAPALEFDEPINNSGSWSPPVFDSDSYDPRNPELVRPASSDEVKGNNSRLLEKQIRRLEATVAKKRAALGKAGKGDAELAQVVRHYENILGELRRSAGIVPQEVASAAPPSKLAGGERHQRCDSRDQGDEPAIPADAEEHPMPWIKPSNKASPGEMLWRYHAEDQRDRAEDRRERRAYVHISPPADPASPCMNYL